MKPIVILFIIITCLFQIVLISQEKNEDKAIILFIETDYNALNLKKSSAELLDILIKVCRLIEKANESNNPFLIFKEKKEEIIQLLKSAMGITLDPQYRKYLNSLAENILSGNYAKSHSDWLDINERSLDIIIQPQEKQKKISFFLLKIDQVSSKKYENYFSLIDKMMANLTMKNISSPLKVSLENPFLFFNVLRSSDLNKFVFVYPDQLKEDLKNGGFKIIFYTNIIKFYFEKIVKPISDLILVDQLKRYVEFDAYLSNMVMHRISHILGPFNVESKSEDLTFPQEKLKELFYCIEEIKADTVSLYNTNVLLKEKLISEKCEKSIYVLFILNLLEKIRLYPLDKENNPFLIMLNYVLKNEGIIYDLNRQKLLLNLSTLKGEIKNLTNEIIQIESNGNYIRAKKFIESYSSVKVIIRLILGIIEKIPKKIKIAVN